MIIVIQKGGFPGDSAIKNMPANTGDIRDVGLIPGSGRVPEGGHGNPLQYSCLENPKDRRAWWATVHIEERVGHDLVTKPPVTIQTFVSKVMSLLLNMLSRFVIAFCLRSKHLLIPWLQIPSSVDLCLYIVITQGPYFI